MTDRDPLLDDVDQAVEMIRARYSQAVAVEAQAARVRMTAAQTLYAALRRRQAVLTAAGLPAPVPCVDCHNEVAVIDGAGSYTSGCTRHELIYEAGELPYATCDRT